jgi:hypothetical protein
MKDPYSASWVTGRAGEWRSKIPCIKCMQYTIIEEGLRVDLTDHRREPPMRWQVLWVSTPVRAWQPVVLHIAMCVSLSALSALFYSLIRRGFEFYSKVLASNLSSAKVSKRSRTMTHLPLALLEDFSLFPVLAPMTLATTLTLFWFQRMRHEVPTCTEKSRTS